VVINRESAKRWPLWMALGTACLVLILSLLNKVSLSITLWRGGVAFVVMYALVTGSVFLFQRSAETSEIEEDEPVEQKPRAEIGKLFDQAVGDRDEEQAALKTAAGQVSGAVAASNVDAKQQAEILRKMGWTTEDKTKG